MYNLIWLFNQHRTINYMHEHCHFRERSESEIHPLYRCAMGVYLMDSRFHGNDHFASNYTDYKLSAVIE